MFLVFNDLILIYTLPVRIVGPPVFFYDCLNYLNFNSVSDEICTINNVKAIKIIFKTSLE